MSDAPATQEEAESLSRVAKAKQAAEERAKFYADLANRKWPGFVMVHDLYRRYRRLNGTALAGNLAFRIFLWMIPASMVLVLAAGVASQQGTDVEGEATSRFGISGSLATAVATAAREGQKSQWQVALIALFGLLLASSGLLSALHYAAVQLWELPPAPPRQRVPRVAKLAGSLILIVTVAGIMGAVRRSGLFIGVMTTFLNGLFTFFLLLALFWIMPRRATSWVWLLPGAALGAVAYVALQVYTAFYLPRHVSSLNATYGAIGVSAAVLGFLFLVGLIITVSTLTNVVWWDYHMARRPVEPGGPVRADLPPPPDPVPVDAAVDATVDTAVDTGDPSGG